MDTGFKKLSRWLIVAGVAQILFGAIVVIWPGISLTALTIVFGAFALTYGLFGIGAALNMLAHKSTDWVPFFISGLAGVVVGVITFVHPAVTALSLTYLVAAWAVIAGVGMVIGAIDLWGAIEGAAWLALNGVLSIAFGVLVAAQPDAGVLAILWLIASYAIIAGITHLVAAWQINQFRDAVAKVAPQMSRQ